MKHSITTRRTFLAYAAVAAVLLVASRTPIGQRIVLASMVEFVEVTVRIVQFPCWLFDHTHCFSLDRFDPTCPQCI